MTGEELERHKRLAANLGSFVIGELQRRWLLNGKEGEKYIVEAREAIEREALVYLKAAATPER